MGPKSPKASTIYTTSTYGSEEGSARLVSLNLILQGNPPGPGDWLFLAVYKGQIVLDGKWESGKELITEALPLNLKEPYYQDLVTDLPLIYLLRTVAGKGSKEPDPLLHADNRFGATVDLFPLIIGQEEIFINVPLLNILTGEPSKCVVATEALAREPAHGEITTVPLIITMISAHCLPLARDGTVYLGAIGLDRVFDPIEVNFGMSLSCKEAEKVVWASASNGAYAANTAISVPNDDRFIPEDLSINTTNECKSCYWNAMKRVRVDPDLLRERLKSPFLFELAGVPRFGKIDVRGRYMAFVDARVLLEPGQFCATVCSKLLFYNEMELPENVGALLELPPSSAKVSARDTAQPLVLDEFGHNAYIVLRFDLCDVLIPKIKIAALYESIGLVPPEAPAGPIDNLDLDPAPDDPSIDVRKIRKEGGALAVQKELSSLACRGAVPMNQGIKKTAANRLLMRVRSMLKQFPPGDCSYIEWQDTVTGQHAASRRAVTSSFAPQPPPARPPARLAATRCRMADDDRIAVKHIKANIKINSRNPRALLCKALRCLDVGNDLDAENYILDGLDSQPKCRYLLWLYGGQEFNKGNDESDMAATAFRIAVKGDYSDGTSNAIGWAAIHALWHYRGQEHAAFSAARKMRKCYELPREWKKFLQRWIDASGEEEIHWIPGVLAANNPILLAAALFLCLRCYKFSDALLNCVENGCATRGSRHCTTSEYKYTKTADIYYVRAASLVLRRKLEEAMQVTTEAIKIFGPSSIMAQMRATCLMYARGWDEECKLALEDADRAGAEICPALLLKAALGGFRTEPEVALQYAARAHKMAPCAHSALVIGRIYGKLKEIGLSERWVAAAVKLEPLLADGWAVLGLIAMYEKKLDKARMMLRTAKQVGPVSQDISEEVKKLMEIVQLEVLPGSMVKDLCLCEYY